MKRVLGILLSVLLLFSSVAFADVTEVVIDGVGTFEVDPDTWPEFDYHDFTQFPLLSEGESATITMVMPRDETYGVDPDQNWFWTWIQRASGVTLNIEQILKSAVSERLNIMLGTGDIPDVLFGMGLTTAQLVQFGVGESLFMPLNEYINEDVMPNLSAWVAQDAAILPALTATDGNIYSLPYLSMTAQPDAGPYFIDIARLEELGIAIPTTLDELNEVLYAMKEKYGEDFYPLGGGWNAGNPIMYIMNAFGYLTRFNDGTSVAIRNGEALIPAGDPTFVEVLKQMKQYYDDGILSPDFVSLSAETVKGQIAEKEVGIFSAELGWPYNFVTSGFQGGSDFTHDWDSIIPLTSDWNDKQQYPNKNGVSVGNFVVSAQAADPELICRLGDFWFGDAGLTYSWFGPRALVDDTFGMCQGFIYVNDGSNKDYRLDHPENNMIAIYSVGSGFLVVGANRQPLSQDFPNQGVFRMWMFGLDTTGLETWEGLYADQSNGDSHARTCFLKNVTPYLVDGFPSVYYISEEASVAMADLSSFIVPYMQTEMAKFITGQRDLSEYDAYLAELNGMGFGEWQQYYKDIYANYLSAME